MIIGTSEKCITLEPSCPCGLDKGLWIHTNFNLLSEGQVPGARLTSLQSMLHQILTTTCVCVQCNYSHFTDEETKVG